MRMLKSLHALKEEDHRKALYAVLVFIMLMILFFLLVGLREPDPPLEEDIIAVSIPDIEIELAGGASGGGDPGSETQNVENNVVESAENIETQTEESVHVESGNGNSNSDNSSNVDESLTFGNGGENGGPGGGTQFGDGPGGGGNDTGTGGGNYNPSRKVMRNPTFASQVQEQGVIALDIWVDATGKVVKTRFKESESTSGSAYLIRLAESAAKSMKYDVKNGAAVEHVGYKTFTFTKS